MRKKVWFNYLYFGALFCLLLTLSVTHLFFHKEHEEIRFFFLFSVVGQAFLETLLFVVVGWYVEAFFPKIFPFFIAITFGAVIYHLLDLVFERILDLSFVEVVQAYVFDESLDNFFYLLDAAGLPLWVWSLIFITLFSIPFLGIAVYHVTKWIISKRPIYLRWEWLLQGLFCVPVALFLWDVYTAKFIESEAHRLLSKVLPWKQAFAHPTHYYMALPSTLSLPLSTPVAKQLLAAAPVVNLETKPNIYLFVVESLREDYISADLTPGIDRFRKEGISADKAFSNANGSHCSWYSIFHSDDAIHWKKAQEMRAGEGSYPLALLKKMGYQVRLYTSAQLGYYDSLNHLFGKEGSLLSSFAFFSHAPPKKAWESDEKAVSALLSDLQNPDLQNGQCCVVFLDATHFDYSFPEGEAKFLPVSADMSYFQAIHSAEHLEAMKNRYKNALAYIDRLFSSFLDQVPKREEARIAFTGDHGEEFYEHGHLFHASHLSDEQIKIPLYFQLPTEGKAAQRVAMMSQIDIFPTLFHSITGKMETYGLMKGHSVLDPRHPGFAISCRYNAGNSPSEFAIHTAQAKLIARFAKNRNVYEAPTVRLLSIEPPARWEEVEGEFLGAFERFFSEKGI